jgi:hypothetical protein
MLMQLAGLFWRGEERAGKAHQSGPAELDLLGEAEE